MLDVDCSRIRAAEAAWPFCHRGQGRRDAWAWDRKVYGVKVEGQLRLSFDRFCPLGKAGLPAELLRNVYGRGYVVDSRESAIRSGVRQRGEQRIEQILLWAGARAIFCAEDVGDAFACGIRQTQRDLQRLSKEGRLIAFGGKKNRRYSKPKKAA